MLLPELGAFLSTQGIGTLGTDIFLGTLPAEPDNCVALRDYGGLAPEHDLGTDHLRYEFPRVQVLVRNTDYVTGHMKAFDIVGDFEAIQDSTLSGVRYRCVDSLQSPFCLKQDENRRWVFACNYQVAKAISTS